VSEWREAGVQAGGGSVESRGRVHYGNARREGGMEPGGLAGPANAR